MELITISGGRLADLHNLTLDDMDIRIIGKALSKLCRFGGHTDKFYSVAQHSVLVSKLLPPSLAFAGLMHDASEAFVMDMPKPIKRTMPDYEELELEVMSQIVAQYDLLDTMDNPQIKHADMRALAIEMINLFPADQIRQSYPWIDEYDIPEGQLLPMKPEHAEAHFIARFKEVAPPMLVALMDLD
ncbi:hypothetical protein [Vibrio phage VpKK5]|uniref:deoxyribonucleoside 5' monophosphate phosphatase n=1 Tax=Vibrio phage VpKK5 TaxID=1538804 RepID=UPI0004F81C2C|nr:deoxyribonucleoside 5' monophosphate phosphatase [Vibrio phage VpKK5]AIM40606.1 hypothetical protein [Vibrio phage VpKK5]